MLCFLTWAEHDFRSNISLGSMLGPVPDPSPTPIKILKLFNIVDHAIFATRKCHVGVAY